MVLSGPRGTKKPGLGSLPGSVGGAGDSSQVGGFEPHFGRRVELTLVRKQRSIPLALVQLRKEHEKFKLQRKIRTFPQQMLGREHLGQKFRERRKDCLLRLSEKPKVKPSPSTAIGTFSSPEQEQKCPELGKRTCQQGEEGMCPRPHLCPFESLFLFSLFLLSPTDSRSIPLFFFFYTPPTSKLLGVELTTPISRVARSANCPPKYRTL